MNKNDQFNPIFQVMAIKAGNKFSSNTKPETEIINFALLQHRKIILIDYLCFQIQCQRLRLEPQLPRLLQAEQQAITTGNGSRQGVDLENSVRSFRKHSRRRPRLLLPVRQHAQLHLQLRSLLALSDPR